MTAIDRLFRLDGKLALIIGSGAVPVAIADLFEAAGAAVVRVADADPTEEAVAAMFAPLGQLDILVNGAVRIGAYALDEMTLERWDRTQATNLRLAFLLMRAAVRTMKAHGRGGRIINISTIGSLHPVLHGNYAYGSSRAGTNALSRQFALDFIADGINTHTILVGAVPSDPPAEGAPPPSGPGGTPARFIGGYGTAADIAPTALLLAADAPGRYINGTSIAIDGGFAVG